MTEDHLLQRLKQELSGDLTAVKPLAEPWKRAAAVFPIWLLLMILTLGVFGLRSDYLTLGPAVVWGFSLAQVAICYLAFTSSLESSVPGRSRTWIALFGIVIAGLMNYLAASWITHGINPSRAEAGHELRAGIACLSAIAIYASLPLLSAIWWIRSGLPLRPRAAGLLLGVGSGIAAEAAWRLHCPISSWDHVLAFHGGAILAAAAAGVIFGQIWQRR